MNKHWLQVFSAAIFEVIWVIGLKHADHSLEWFITGISLVLSFYLLLIAGKGLPVGTVYSVFVGLGTAGTVLTESISFHEPLPLEKIILILLLLIGVIGLKLTTEQGERS